MDRARRHVAASREVLHEARREDRGVDGRAVLRELGVTLIDANYRSGIRAALDRG